MPDLIWSHNDSGHEPAVVGFSSDGRFAWERGVPSARNRDWEDMAAGACGTTTCLYIADTGDNQESRDHVVLYRLPERDLLPDSISEEALLASPVPDETVPVPTPPSGSAAQPQRTDPTTAEPHPMASVEAFPMVFPDGPRDTEALFVLPGETVYLITKGRNHPISVYRYPPPLRPNVTVQLELVQHLSDGAARLPDQVTGADASPNGGLVAVRTYRTFTFYSVDQGRLRPLPGGSVDLASLREGQGEAVGFGLLGRIALTSEAGPLGRGASLQVLECSGVRQDPNTNARDLPARGIRIRAGGTDGQGTSGPGTP